MALSNFFTTSSARQIYVGIALTVCLIFCTTPIVDAQSISWGKCTTTLPVMQDFSLEKFVGTWYEEWRVYHLPEAPYQCVWNELTPDTTPGNYNFSVYGGWYVYGKKIMTKLGGRITPWPETNSKWHIHLSWFAPTDPYWILNTDYKTYALTFSCEQKGPFKLETAWILRRDPLISLDRQLVDDLKNFFVLNNMDNYKKRWQLVNNNDCNYTSPNSPQLADGNA